MEMKRGHWLLVLLAAAGGGKGPASGGDPPPDSPSLTHHWWEGVLLPEGIPVLLKALQPQERQGDDEARTLAGQRLDAHPAAVGLDEALHDRQAEAGATLTPVAAAEVAQWGLSHFVGLTALQPRCVILKDVLDHSLEEIAEELGLSVPAVKAGGCRVAARDQRSRILGIVKWKSGPYLSFENVSPADDVAKGDTVVSSGLGGIFPEGLVIGTIKSVAADTASFFRKIELSPAVGFSALDEVFILVPQKSPEGESR